MTCRQSEALTNQAATIEGIYPLRGCDQRLRLGGTIAALVSHNLQYGNSRTVTTKHPQSGKRDLWKSARLYSDPAVLETTPAAMNTCAGQATRSTPDQPSVAVWTVEQEQPDSRQARARQTIRNGDRQPAGGGKQPPAAITCQDCRGALHRGRHRAGRSSAPDARTTQAAPSRRRTLPDPPACRFPPSRQIA